MLINDTPMPISSGLYLAVINGRNEKAINCDINAPDNSVELLLANVDFKNRFLILCINIKPVL